MTRAHYCPASTGARSRTAVCGVSCVPWTPTRNDTGHERGTSRMLFVRCQKCIDIMRLHRLQKASRAPEALP